MEDQMAAKRKKNRRKFPTVPLFSLSRLLMGKHRSLMARLSFSAMDSRRISEIRKWKMDKVRAVRCAAEDGFWYT